MDKIIPIAILVLFIILTASWLFSRYRMCPPDKILIVFGKVGTGQPAKCYHGGSTFVLPVLQSYSYLDLNPINIDVPLQGALSSQNIRVDVPSSFIVGISTPAGNHAECRRPPAGPHPGGNPQPGRGNHHGPDACGDCLHDH